MQNKSRKPPKCISSDLVQTLFSQGFRKFWIFFFEKFFGELFVFELGQFIRYSEFVKAKV